MKYPTQNTHNRGVKNLVHKKIKIGGMVYESCEKIIERSLQKKDGIKHIKVDYVNSTASISFEESKTLGD